MIKELTKKQSEQVPVYLKKWMDAGLRTKAIDQDKAKACVNFLYGDILDKKLPKYYIFLDSPMQANLAINLLGMKGKEHSQLGSQLYSQLRSQLRSQLGSQLDSQLRSQLGSQLYSQKLTYYYPTFDGWWYNYYKQYDFVLNELFPEKKSQPEFVKFRKLMDHMKEVHYVFMFEEICFISDFPKEINLNSDGRLHNIEAGALIYRDGYELYSLNGIRMEKEKAMLKPEEMTKELILNEKNADIRREHVRKLTGQRMIEILQPKVLDEKYGYELLAIDLGDNRVRPFLKMTNPSIDTVHIEGVRPECRTVEDAINFRNTMERFSLPKTLDGYELFSEKVGDYHQQGDCLFFPEVMPSEARLCDHKVAGEGLIRHMINSGEVYEAGSVRYVLAHEDCTITHPEHKSTRLDEGVCYRVGKTFEFDHWLEESREVID